MSVKILTEHHLEFLSLKGGYRGSSEFTLVLVVENHMLRLVYVSMLGVILLVWPCTCLYIYIFSIPQF